MKKLRVYIVIMLFVFAIGCSKDKKQESTDTVNEEAKISEEVPTKEAAVTQTVDKILDEMNKLDGMIKDQSFDVNLDGFGDVTFAAFQPEESETKDYDVIFKLLDGTKELFTFPGFNEENRRTGEEFIKVVAVSFTDYNEDGKKDIVVINEYANQNDTKENNHYNDVRVYTQTSDSNEFSIDGLISEFLMKNYYNDSIASVLDGMKEYKDYEASLNGNDSIQAQLELIANQKDQWIQDDVHADGGYGIVLTDLNHNGRLEIIASYCGGTGIYTFSDYYEVNETYDGLNQCMTNYQEGDSQADIETEEVTCYLDSSTDIYYYIFNDFMKSSAAEFYENKRAISLENGEMKEIMLAYVSTIYQNQDEFTTSYMDSNQKEITEKQYYEIEDTEFSDLTKLHATFGWYHVFELSELTDLSHNDLLKVLTRSYDAFTVD